MVLNNCPNCKILLSTRLHKGLNHPVQYCLYCQYGRHLSVELVRERRVIRVTYEDRSICTDEEPYMAYAFYVDGNNLVDTTNKVKCDVVFDRSVQVPNKVFVDLFLKKGN